MTLAAAIVCSVLSIHDGDTLTMACGEARTVVRLMEIDAPELGQPYAAASRRALATLCAGRSARVEAGALDRYGRQLARVSCAGRDASLTQVGGGWAWAYRRYLTDPAIAAAEQRARDERRGLWRGRTQIPPWEFRKQRRGIIYITT